ncbi:MAG: sensor histidine kinase [Clostridia bacterium]|nr:sensor histidine kinase [Clostridia bacterium]
MGFKNMRKMHVQLKIYVFVILLLAIVLLSLLYYINASTLLTKDNELRTSEAVSQSAKYIEGYLNKLKAMSDVIAMDVDTKEFLELSTPQSESGIQALMELILAGDNNILSLALVSVDGHSIVVGQDMAMTLSEDMMNQNWYMEAKNSHQMPALNAVRMSNFTSDKNKWVVSISREVVNDDNEHLGVLLMDLEYRFFENYFQSMDLGNNGYAFIIDEKGQVVYHPNESYFENEGKAEQLQAILREGTYVENNKTLIKYQKAIGHSTWTLVGLSSLENLDLLKREVIFSLFFVGTIVFFIALVGSAMISRKITQPIKALEASMDSVHDEWHEVPVEQHTFEEVQELTYQYNLLVREIKKLMTDIKKQEQLTREQEIKALQSQINPHFLYNTLDTIVWLAEFKASDKIIDVTKSLSGLLRVALKKDDGLIALEEELEHVEHYLKIQSMRYESYLTYVIDMPKDLSKYKVPKLVVQPLVENAIYHGIRPKDEPGIIRISANIQNDALEILVEDDGVGINLKEEKDLVLGGVGLTNVHQRIQLICGEAYGLKIDHFANPTQVKLRIPLDL